MAQLVSHLKRLLRKVVPPRAETSAVGTTVVLAGAVGIVAGLMALLISWMIGSLNRNVFFGIGTRPDALPAPWRFALVLVPPVVFLLIAYVIRRWAPEVRGTGIARVMSAVGRSGGYIRRRVIVLKPIATALCIGAGAPLGMEGPVVQTGAAVGSLAGHRFRMGVSNIRILVAAGAAAGLAAKYGAPVGGAVFSAELILGSASTAALLPLIVAAFLGVLARHAILGNVPEYVVPAEASLDFVDYPLFIVLGVACGLAGAYFIKMIFFTEDGMGRLLKPWWSRAVVVGLLVGACTFVFPELLGTGKPVIQKLLQGEAPGLWLLLAFVLLKPMLSSATISAGASGGIFGPSIFTGAALGALFAGCVSGLLPLHMAPSAYVMAGMAGVMAAVMRAPLQAILVTFELTHNYSMIAPLMITCVVSMKVSELFEPESAFTRRLVRIGERLKRGMDFSLLEGLAVRDVMQAQYVALPAAASIRDIDEAVRASENRTFPVISGDGRLRGIVMLATLIAGGIQSKDSDFPPEVADLIEPRLVYLKPDDSLYDAWEMMGNHDYDCLPVCRSGPEGLEMVGICEKEAILELYDRQAFISINRQASR